MFGFGKKKKEKQENDNKKSEKESKGEAKESNESNVLTLTDNNSVSKPATHQDAKDDLEDVSAMLKRLDIPESPYSSPYPFTECSPKILTAYASSVYNANEGRLLTIEMEKEPLSYIFSLLTFVFKLMEETYSVDISSCRFCDCMGLHLQVGMIAASFPFRGLLSIELDEELASRALHKLRSSEFGKMSCPVSYEIGFFKDYVDLYKEMEMLYLDCNLLGPLLDEGMLLKVAFECFSQSRPGTYLLLLTQQSPRIDFSKHSFKVVFQRKNTPNGTVGNFWLCQKVSEQQK